MIGAGRKLIEALDESPFKVTAAMWFYLSENDEWRLIIASPYIDKEGPKKSYEFIQDQLDKLSKCIDVVALLRSGLSSYLSLENISVVSPSDDLIKLMRPAITTGPGISPIRFTRNVINNTLIEDAYIYRMT